MSQHGCASGALFTNVHWRKRASERGRGGSSSGCTEVTVLPLGTRAAPHPRCAIPSGAEPPQRWQRPWARGWGLAGLSLLPALPPPGAAVIQSGTWGRGEHWKLNTALSNHESPEITLPPPDTHTHVHIHTLTYRDVGDHTTWKQCIVRHSTGKTPACSFTLPVPRPGAALFLARSS